MGDGQHNGGPPLAHRPCRVGDAPKAPEIIWHAMLAMTRHVRQLHHEGLPVPREVEELAVLLMQLAKTRQDPPALAGSSGTTHYAPMPDRLLVTKSEAAERLGVSVRTIERLVASDQLRQVHIERLARFRVSDLEAYVNSLGQDQGPGSNSTGENNQH
jgi:excisionase family DNA binding protein